MQIQIHIDREGAIRRFCKQEGPVVVGRAKGGASVDLDLSDDSSVSRLHARIWYEDDVFWIEDLGSAHGTFVDGENIKELGAKRLGFDIAVRIGKTFLRLENPLLNAMEVSPQPANEQDGVTLVERLDAAGSGVVPAGACNTVLERQLDLLCEMAFKLGAESQIDHAMHAAVEHAVQIIPNAKRGAIVLVERGSGRLMLKAHLPGEFRPSERLAWQAINKGEGFTWIRSNATELSDVSIHGSGMYVPLLAGGQAIGALCIDSPEPRVAFNESDLRVLRAIGQFIGMAIEQHQVRADLARQAEFTNRMFSSRFPESVRESLITQAAEGTLPMGTRRSQVTVLQSDIRGFTRLSEEVGPHRLNDLLSAYFPPLIEAIFSFGGSVERLVGDAIFAVYGTPEADNAQQEHAVRSALAMQQAVAEVSAFRAKRKQPTCEIGVGIDCGEVLHGFIGNAEWLEFAVIGNAANYASRYCNAAKPGEILISSNVHAHVWKLVESEPRLIGTKHEGEIEAHIIRTLR